MSTNCQVAGPHSTWRNLPKLPKAIAGQCVGTIGDALVVAGGYVIAGGEPKPGYRSAQVIGLSMGGRW